MVLLWKSFTKRGYFSPFLTLNFSVNNRFKIRSQKTFFLLKKRFIAGKHDSTYFFGKQMNISPHLLIDAVILTTALTITLLLRAKGNANAAREEKESKWLLKKEKEEFKETKLLKISNFFIALLKPFFYIKNRLISRLEKVEVCFKIFLIIKKFLSKQAQSISYKLLEINNTKIN